MRNKKLQYLILLSYTAAEDGSCDGYDWMAQLHEALVAAVQYGAVPRIQATRED
jgi:hypothetical protein